MGRTRDISCLLVRGRLLLALRTLQEVATFTALEGLHLSFQLFDNLLELLSGELNVVGRLILDHLDPLSKLERLDGFLQVNGSSTGGADESGLGISSKGFSKQLCEF